MSATASLCIHQESTAADVVAYIGLKLQGSEFVEDLKRFIEDQAIDGMRFLSLDAETLFLYGLSPREKRECLWTFVQAVNKELYATLQIAEKRRKRLEELVSKIPELKVDRHEKKQKYVAMSDIKLEQVTSIYNFQPYVQNRAVIPDEEFKLLYDQLNVITKNSKGIKNVSRNLQLISPVLWCLTKIVPGLEISCEEAFCGDYILLRGRFNFVLYKEMLHVGLVEGKKEDMDQGLSQLLMGHEVMGERTPSKTILGVVSTFDRWDFIRNEPETIYRDEGNQIHYEVSQNSEKFTINEESLRKIVEKLHGLLLENTS